jgi:uncharacterized protein YaaR (DUF327 family)
MSKIVYFLGAGATKAIAPNAPMNMDLVKKAIEDFSNSHEAKRLNRFIKELYKRNDPVVDNQIWNLLDYIIQQGKSPSLGINLEQIIDLKNDLMSLVIREFNKSLAEVDFSVAKDFIEKVKSHKPTIISTNYDLIIDDALLHLSTKHNFGVKIRKTVSRDAIRDVEGLKRPAPAGLGDFVNSGEISLLKIHGSLNWIYCPKCDEVDLTIREKGAMRTLQGLYCIDEHCTCKYKSLLITPTMYKDYENRIIKETWACAENKLIEADELVFIGYALWEEDYQIRCLLMKAMLTRKKNHNKITVIEREPRGPDDLQFLNENIKKKYENLYGTVNFKPIGFKKYVEEL